MFVSTSQVIVSLERLRDLHPFFGFAFFGFKKGELPIGSTIPFGYSEIRQNVLEPYYGPIESYEGFFNPFKSNKTWVGPRYDTTSLQRIVADTFGAAFVHKKGDSEWGWQPDYVDILRRLMKQHQSSLIPLIDICVWLYHDDGRIPNEGEAPAYLVNRAMREFKLTSEELSALFTPARGRAVALSPEAPNLNEVWNVLGWPAGVKEEGGVSLKYLSLTDVGPVKEIIYSPRERLNILTGDNSLGKTFLMDCVWWAVTGNWARHEAEPRRSSRANYAEIGYGIRSQSGRTTSADVVFNWIDEDWQRPLDQHEALAIYATHSGSFALWDPVRLPNESKSALDNLSHLVLSREHVWDGLAREDARGKKVQLSNGLIHDWVTWQSSKDRYSAVLRPFEQCLRELSPPDGPNLRPGKLARIASDSREFPSIKMPYGDVPIVYASAGVQRIIALAYILVWHWTEHARRCEKAGRKPFSKMVLIIDEIEAHLHPRWQRQILPAIMRTLKLIAPNLAIQIHISTHSPLVLASSEPNFDIDQDAIHHLYMNHDNVMLEEFDTYKHGSVDSWLESEIFGLSSARSLEAERAIERAKEIQLEDSPSTTKAQQIHTELLRTLPDDDTFWVRWLYFAEQLGAIKGPKRDSRKSRA